MSVLSRFHAVTPCRVRYFLMRKVCWMRYEVIAKPMGRHSAFEWTAWTYRLRNPGSSRQRSKFSMFKTEYGFVPLLIRLSRCTRPRAFLLPAAEFLDLTPRSMLLLCSIEDAPLFNKPGRVSIGQPSRYTNLESHSCEAELLTTPRVGSGGPRSNALQLPSSFPRSPQEALYR